MITSKLTTKAQTTIPQPVRVALRLDPGDQLAYEIDDQRVILTKARSGGKADDPSALSTNGAPRQTPKPMPDFRQGDVIKVPFPYTDRATRQTHTPTVDDALRRAVLEEAVLDGIAHELGLTRVPHLFQYPRLVRADCFSA